MPRGRKNRTISSVQQEQSLDEENMVEHRDKMHKIDGIINNFKATAATQRKLLENEFDAIEQAESKEFDIFLGTLSEAIKNMTVKEYVKMKLAEFEKSEKSTATENLSANSHVISEVDRCLRTIDEMPVDIPKTGKGRKKKAPQTSKKASKKLKENKEPFKTPSVSTLPPSWKDTPFVTPHPRLMSEPREITFNDLDGLLTKLQFFTSSGSPVMYPLKDERLQERVEEVVKQNIQTYSKIFQD